MMSAQSSPSDAPDPDLAEVRALQDGDASALEPLMERHADALFRFVNRSVNHRERARDLVQATFTKAYFSIAQFTGRGNFKAWLYRIALNQVRDALKSQAHRNWQRTDSLDFAASETQDTIPPPSALVDRVSADEQMQNREALDALRIGIARLPEDLRPAFVLAVLEELSHEECAAILGLTAKAVEMRVYKARKRLREDMAKFLDS